MNRGSAMKLEWQNSERLRVEVEFWAAIAPPVSYRI